MKCNACGEPVLDIDVRCGSCGAVLTSTGSHRLLGATVLGVYELVDVLGQGGMSVVFKGRHKMTDQEVALKLLPPELAAHSQVKSRFIEEAKALAALDHPNIVHLYNFGQENGSFVLAMQFVPGKTWERMIIENKRLDWQFSTKICLDVLRALEYAHSRGVVHRDMKPSNVLVRESDGAATVMDFGIAKMTTSAKLTATGQTMGTVRYMSPEQVRGQEVDLRTDIYSLGATLYESLLGDTPFDGETHFEIMTKHLGEAPVPITQRGIALPAALEDALLKSLAKKPEDRFASAREFRVILEGVLAQADLAHGETQKVSREFMRAASIAPTPAATGATLPSFSAKTAPTVPAGARGAELTEAAASLPMAPMRGGSRKWLAATLAVLVLGAGAATWYFALRESATKTTQKQLWQPTDKLIVQTEGAGAVGLESVAAADPQAIAKILTAYGLARGYILDYYAATPTAPPISIPIHRIIEVDKSSLCAAINMELKQCDTADFPFFFRFEDNTLFFAKPDDPDRLLEGVFLYALLEAVPMGVKAGDTNAALKLRADLETFLESKGPAILRRKAPK